MSLSINTNYISINAQRNLSLGSSSLATSMQRLSSGLRINSAKDDAAGLAISERMHAQVRGMNQAARNANDGISLLQTAEGAASKVGDMLQRMRELAVQSANGTNSDSDRKALNAEVQQLKAEIDRVGAGTKFNGAQIFDQSREIATAVDPAVKEVTDKLKAGLLARVEQLVLERFGIQAPAGSTMKVETYEGEEGGVLASVTPLGGKQVLLKIDMKDYPSPRGEAEFIETLAHEMVHAVMATGASWSTLAQADKSTNWFIEGVAEFVAGADSRLSADIQNSSLGAIHGDDLSAWESNSANYSSGYMAVKYMNHWIKGQTSGAKDLKDVLQYLQTESGKSLDDAIKAATGSTNGLTEFKNAYAALDPAKESDFTWMNLTNTDSGSIAGTDAGGGSVALSGEATTTPNTSATGDMKQFTAQWEPLGKEEMALGKVLGFQVGANAGDFVYANVGSMNLGAMGIDKLDISTTDGATSALSRLDNAIDYVSSQRGTMGAQMNRFEAVIATLQISSENTAAARGRITDADFAVETANLSRAQILQQAGTAMVAQANQLPQNVLSLLR